MDCFHNPFQANVNSKNFLGHTALHDAADSGKVDVLERLIKALKARDDINATNDNGSTALHLASLWGNVDCVSLLIDAGANVNAKNNDLNTPLHEASWFVKGQMSKKDKDECCRLLIESGAEEEVKNSRGKTPHDYPILAERRRKSSWPTNL